MILAGVLVSPVARIA
ncbi:hypothetical protein D039_4859A, partial [Vibrio parahaemolyticus EKP-028]